MRELAELIGGEGLAPVDRSYMRFADVFESRLVAQRPDEDRTLDQTLQRAWEALGVLPASELTRIRPELVARRRREGGDDAPAPSAG